MNSLFTSRPSMKALVALLLAATLHLHAQTIPDNPRVEWLEDPVAVEAEKPRLSWSLGRDERLRGQRQSAYRILVASSHGELEKGNGDLWDSGKVASSNTLGIEYSGKPLASGQRAFWKVKTWDKDGKEGAWGAISRWDMGLLKPEDWKARWISFKDTTPLHADRTKLHLPPPRTYRKSFKVKGAVKQATLYSSALGIVDVRFNGQPLNGPQYGLDSEYFAPGWSDYRERAYYRAYDATSALLGPSNVDPDFEITAVVAEGWYAGYVGYGLLVGYGPNRTGRNIYGKTPALLIQLDIEFMDGTRQTIGTDESWEVTSDGPYREADMIMGETYDARLDSLAVRAARKWEPAILAEKNGSVKASFHDPLGAREVELGFQKPKRMAAYSAQPVRALKGISPTSVKEQRPGVWIFDFGQNFAGNVLVRATGETDTKLTLRYGEMLHADGSLMTENLRRARATDNLILAAPGLVWTPRFTYHGFRYVELTGFPGKPSNDMLVGQVIHNDTPFAGTFACSDEAMTQFWRNTVWTQKANFIEIPTDCPQRDERLGWLGDAQIYARTATYNADVAAFFTKWIDDVREAQRDSGAYPDYAPYPYAHGEPGATHGTAWTDAGVMVPHTMWKVYRDKRLIEKHWASMVKFMDWRAKTDPGLKGVKVGNTWGDWLNVKEETPIEYIDLCYHYHVCTLMAELATGIGKDPAPYTARAAKLRESFLAQHWKGDGVLSVKTQSADVLALWSGVLPEDKRPPIAKALAAKIEANGHRMATGFLGTKSLLTVLTHNGHHDLACRLFQSRKFPSWGYEVEQGATTVWERWDSYTKEHGFNGASGKNNAAMNSFSHYAFGAVMEWAYRELAGLDNAPRMPGDPDYPAGLPKTLDGLPCWLLKPNIPSLTSNPDGEPLKSAVASTEHALGGVVINWSREAGRLKVHIEIPANTAAALTLPEGATELTEGNQPILQAKGITALPGNGTAQVLALGSGTYRFEMKAK